MPVGGMAPQMPAMPTTPAPTVEPAAAASTPVDPMAAPLAPVVQPMAPQMPIVGGIDNSGNVNGGDQGGQMPPVAPGV